MIILGISGLYHDSAAAIINENEIIAAVQEERFTRKKHDNSLPVNSIRYCLKVAQCEMFEVDKVVYYDNPMLTLDRFVNNVLALGKEAEYIIENQLDSIVTSRLVIDKILRKKFGKLGKKDRLLVCEHHISHAASAFYPSPFQHAAILTIDGVGEWATTTIGKGCDEKIQVMEEIDYPHSLGLLYSAFTSFCGFKVNSGDYKFMGLAPYGEPIYYDLIKDKLIDLKEDGSYRLNLDYFDFYKGKYMTNEKFADLFTGPPREQESIITRREMDIAASVQKLTEEIILLLVKHAKKITGETNLCIAGGVALNCVANGKILKSGLFDHVWIQPAAGDAGGALGCAMYALYSSMGVKRKADMKNDMQKGSYLGVEYKNAEVCHYLEKQGYPYQCVGEDEVCLLTAQSLAEGKVVGWFQGRMEFGPRALGNRSILADPTALDMQSKLNLKIKYRESFRPFAPAVLKERVNDYFELDQDSPYMLIVADVRAERRKPFDKNNALKGCGDDMLPIVNMARSDIPAVTHIDYSARIQTVSLEQNERFYKLIKEFEKITGYGVVINTSFNVRGEPIVCALEDAYRCFMRTEMDVLVLDTCILRKDEQPQYIEEQNWRDVYGLD